MRIEKNQSGLLLYEDFKEQNLIWLPSPDNYNNIEFTQSGLQIAHSDMYKTITIQKPDEDNFIFSCKINHNPVDTSDIGGVIIISDKRTYIECQSYLANEESYITNADRYEEVLKQEIEKYIDYFVTYSIVSDTGVDPNVDETGEEDPTVEPEPFYDSVYPYIRVICHGETYSFFASTDNVNWVELGSGVLDANRIGFFLYSHAETNTPFNIEYAALYKSNYIIINNIPENLSLEMITNYDTDPVVFTDSNVFIKRKENKIFIDSTLIECPMNNTLVNIKDSNSNIIYTNLFTQIVGGDNFTLWYDIDMFVDQQKINPNEIYDLGMFINEYNYIRIDLVNNEEFPVNNIKLEIEKYSDYYVGEQNIGIAVYEQGKEDNYNLQKSIIIDRIEPSESQSFIIGLINRQTFDFYNMINDKRFKILLSNL